MWTHNQPCYSTMLLLLRQINPRCSCDRSLQGHYDPSTFQHDPLVKYCVFALSPAFVSHRHPTDLAVADQLQGETEYRPTRCVVIRFGSRDSVIMVCAPLQLTDARYSRSKTPLDSPAPTSCVLLVSIVRLPRELPRTGMHHSVLFLSSCLGKLTQLRGHRQFSHAGCMRELSDRIGRHWCDHPEGWGHVRLEVIELACRDISGLSGSIPRIGQ